MEKPRLYGSPDSVYYRIAALTLFEKSVAAETVFVDVFDNNGLADWYVAKHPFGKIPLFEHGPLQLYETRAICRYIDEVFAGPALQPGTPADRAVMAQIISIMDNYAYRPFVWDIYVETIEKTLPDPARIAAALPIAETCLAALSKLKRPGKWLLGDDLSLADLHAASMFEYFTMTAIGRELLASHPPLLVWWDAIQARASFKAIVAATRPTLDQA